MPQAKDYSSAHSVATPSKSSICAKESEFTPSLASGRHRRSPNIPELDRIFVASDKGGICKIYDRKSFRALSELNLEDDADNVRYAASSKRIYVGFGSGGI